MSIISISSTDTEHKDNMEDEESDDEVILSNETPYQDEPFAEADQTEGEDEGSGNTCLTQTLHHNTVYEEPEQNKKKQKNWPQPLL